METVALFLYPLFMVFELLMFAVLAITFFLSVIVVNTGADLKEMELHKYYGAIFQWWLVGNGLAFLVYLVVSALH